MFCNRCGAVIQPDFNLCPKCGNPVREGAATNPAALTAVPARTRLQRHLRTVGILWIVVGALWIIPSLAMIGFSHAPRFIISDEMFMQRFMPPMMLSVGSLFLLIAVGGIFMGWGLMRHERWARITAIVLGIVALLHPPFGTALGAYTLWVLMPADSAAEYERLSR